jgi:glyoxylase-like metal-dependent hydrolase (beta-lactamase superfamily II)
LKWKTVVSQPFEENSFVVHLEGHSECLIIDPGFEPELILAAIRDARLTPVAILNTHGHSDHIAGNAAMKSQWPTCPLIIGHGDAVKLEDPHQNLSAPFGVSLRSPPADRTVREGDQLVLGGMTLSVWETPGHSSGHVVYLCRDHDPWVLFNGDVLFAGSVGRSDFPDSNPRDLVRSIQQKLFELPGETIVLTGHGPATTIERERRTNPFVGAPAGYKT